MSTNDVVLEMKNLLWKFLSNSVAYYCVACVSLIGIPLFLILGQTPMVIGCTVAAATNLVLAFYFLGECDL